MFEGKKSQVVFLGIMICIMLFITLVALLEPLKQIVVIARDPQHLDCSNVSISVGTSGACIITDWFIFYFAGVVIAAGIAYITGMGIAGRLRGG